MTNLALIETGLMNIYESASQDRIVSGRELHEFLEVKTRYTDWMNRMIGYGFDENIDFLLVTQKRETNNPKNPYTSETNHHMKLDMSKEIAMIQRNEKGKMARQYFIEIEKKYQQQNQLSPMSIEDMIIQQATNHKEIRLKQEAHDFELKELKERADKQESNVVEMKSYMVDSPDYKTIQHEINKYARRNNMQSSEVRNMVYRKIEDLHGIDIYRRVDNARKKLQEERVESGKKPYADSTLKSKVTGMDIIREEQFEKKMLEILASS